MGVLRAIWLPRPVLWGQLTQPRGAFILAILMANNTATATDKIIATTFRLSSSLLKRAKKAAIDADVDLAQLLRDGLEMRLASLNGDGGSKGKRKA